MLPLGFASCAAEGDAGHLSGLTISQNGRFLVETDTGSPFFWLGDTAWRLTDLPPDEVDYYLRDRAARGFTLIQGPIIIDKPDFDSPGIKSDYAGESPLLVGAEGVVLNERYLQHVDYIIDQALKHGLYIALAVIWGSAMDQILAVDNPQQARDIGNKLGQRYRDRPNVIWIVCGEYHKIAWETTGRDRTRPNDKELSLINALAEGLESGHEGASLMTVHPDGRRSSSEYFHDAAWLDFHMIQTNEIVEGAANLIAADYALTDPVRPTLNAEGGYEGRNNGSSNDPMTAYKVRYEAYHSVFQGAMGHTYGHWDIWLFSDNWHNALDSEGARTMGYLRALMESRPMAGGSPDQALIRNDEGKYAALRKLRAIMSADNGSAFVYFPDSDVQTELDPSGISGENINAWWFNPRDGQNYTQEGVPSGEPFAVFKRGHPPNNFSPPGSFGQADWVLVLDDASRNFKPPGRGRIVKATTR